MDTGEGKVKLGFGARYIQLGPSPRFEQDTREVHSLPLILGILARHGELVLGAAELKVVAGHFRQETDGYITTRGFNSLDVGCAGLNGTTYTSKEIHLPTG